MSIMTITKLMAMKLLKIENGNISLFGRLGFIMPADAVLSLHESVETRFGKEAADQVVYDTGYYQSSSGSKKYLERKSEIRSAYATPAATGNVSLEMGREMLKITGLGDIMIKEVIDNGRKVVLATPNSPFAIEHLKTRGKSQRPVCHYLRGVMTGVLESYYKGKYSCEEKACLASGLSTECIFEFRKTPG